jgi:hypothetical protein
MSQNKKQDAYEGDDIVSPVTKEKKKEDWNYLKQTLNMQPGEQFIDPQLLTFHEKVDRIVDEEEELRNKHL